MKSTFKILSLVAVLAFLVGCSDDNPQKEDIPELITKAVLTFTPASGSSAAVVKVTATDPDGQGSQSIKIDGPINLNKGVTYTLSIEMYNELAKTTDPEYNISNEVKEEGVEHQFYFSWTGNVFSSPTGDGNIDNRNDALNYKDKDENNLPIGLTTEWTAASSASSGEFRVVLKHQPELKSATSTFADGETDLNLEKITITVN